MQAGDFLLENLEPRLLLDGEFIWANAAGGDWNLGSNWAGGVAPTANSSIVIGALDVGARVNFTGTATMASVTVSTNGALTVQSGTLTVSTAGTLQTGSSLAVSSGATLAIGSGATVGLAGVVTVDGTLSNSGITTVSSGGSVTVSSSAWLKQNEGSFTLLTGSSLTLNSGARGYIYGGASSGGVLENAGGSLVVDGGARVNVVGPDGTHLVGGEFRATSGTNNFTNGSLLENDGGLITLGTTVTLSGEIGSWGDRYVQTRATCVLQLNGGSLISTTSSTRITITNGTIAGTGTVSGNDLNLTATLRPGGVGAVGTITFAILDGGNSLAFGSSTQIEMDLIGGSADQILITGTAGKTITYGTAVIPIYVTAAAGTTVGAADTYTLIQTPAGATVTGTFRSITPVIDANSGYGLRPIVAANSPLTLQSTALGLGDTYTYTGPPSGSWTDAANWLLNGSAAPSAPTFLSNVVIPSGLASGPTITAGIYAYLNSFNTASPQTITGGELYIFSTTTPSAFTAALTLSGGVLDNAGALTLATVSGAGRIISTSGTLTISVNTTLTASTFVFKGGTLQINASRTFTFSGSTLVVPTGATLAGSGTLASTVNVAGTIAPGGVGTVGTLTISGALTFTSTGALRIDLTTAASYDVLAVTGVATLGGSSLILSAIGAPVLDGGAIVTFLTASSVSGTFATVTSPSGFIATLSYATAGQVRSTFVTSEESSLSTTLRAGLPDLQNILQQFGAFFNLGAINYSAHGSTQPALAVLPGNLDDLFGLHAQLSDQTLPTLGSTATNEALVAALIAAGFTVDSISGGANVNGTVIPNTTGGVLIQIRYTASLISSLTIDSGFAGNTFNAASPSLLQGLGSSLSLNGGISWTGSLDLSFIFGVDGTGFFVSPDSALVLAAAGSGTVSGSGTIGGKTSISLSGTGSANLTLRLQLAGSSVYRLGDLDGHLADVLAPTITGSASVSLGFTVGALSLTYAGTYTQTADLAARTNAISLAGTLTGTLAIPQLKNSVGAATTVSVTGSYASGTNTWTLTGSVSDLRIYGLTVTSGSFSVALKDSVFTGTGSLDIVANFLSASSSPVTLSLTASFGADSGTFTATAALTDLVVKSNQGASLLTAASTTITVTLTVNFATPSLTGSFSFDLGSATLTPDSSYTAAITDGADADAIAASLSYNFATQVLSFSFDTLTLTVTNAFRVVATAFTATYDRSSASTSQTLATLANLTVDVLALETVSATGPPTLTISGLTIRQDGFSIANATATVGDLKLGSFVTFVAPSLSLVDFNYTQGAAPTGTITFSTSSATLYPGQSLVTAALGTVSGTFTLSTGRFSISVGTLNVTAGEAFTLSATGITLGYDPTAAAGQTLVTIGTATASTPTLAHFGTATLTGLVLTDTSLTIGSFALTQNSGQTSRFGSYLELTGASVAVTNFVLNFAAGASSVSGTVTLTVTAASLFPDSAAIGVTLGAVTGSYDFAHAGSLKLTVGTLVLRVGDALNVTATNITLTPSATTLATIATATVSSPVISNLGTVELTNFALTQTGFSIGSFSLTQAANTTAAVGDFLTFSGASITATNLVVDTTAPNLVTGTVTLAVTAASLFPNLSAIGVTIGAVSGTYDFAGGSGHLRITVGSLVLKVGEAVTVTASNITLSPTESTITTLASATVDSPLIANLAPTTLTDLVVTQTGFSLGSLTLAQNAGTATIGDFLSFTGASLTITNLAVDTTNSAAPITGTVAFAVATASLFPNGGAALGARLTGVSATYALTGANPTGQLSVAVTGLTLTIGEAVEVTASNVTFTPGQATIATIGSATVNTPTIAGFGGGTLTDFAITRTGFSLGNLTLTQSAGTATLGSIVSFTGASLVVSNLAYNSSSANPFSGSVALSFTSATLFPGAASFLTATLGNVTASYAFSGASPTGKLSLTAETFDLRIGEAFKLSASNIAITPGNATIATIGSATLTSPTITNLASATLTDVAITQTGFSIANFTLAQTPNTTALIGSALSVTGASLAVANFAYDSSNSANPVSGTVTLTVASASLFSGQSLFTTTLTGIAASFSLGGAAPTGALSISVTSFDLKIGEALTVSASNITLTPGAATLVTIGSASVSSPTITNLAPVTLENLAITQTGFSLGSLTIAQTANTTAKLGSVLSFTGASLAVTNFAYNSANATPVTGTITLTVGTASLFPDASLFSSTLTSLVATYFLGGANPSGALSISVGSFSLTLGEALRITASDLTLTPGAATIATIGTATISSPKITGLDAGTLTDLAITSTGFTLGNFTLAQTANTTAKIGNFLSFTGASLTATNLAYDSSNSANPVSGTLAFTVGSATLFPGSTLLTSTLTGLTASYAFSGANPLGGLTISVTAFTLKVGEALQIGASNLVITPGQSTLVTLASATISSPQFTDFGSGTLTNLAITQTGFSVGSLTLGQSGGQTVNFGNFLRLTGAQLTATDFAVAFGDSTTVTGTIGLSATAISLFPESSLFTTTVTDFATTYNFGAGGDGALRISVGAFALKIGEALKIDAANIVITPGQSTILTLASAAISSPQFADFGSGTLTNLAITQTGFSLGSFTLGQSGGQTVNFGNFLRLTGATFSATNFAVVYGGTTTVTGTIGLSATAVSLFPDSTLFTTTVTDFTTTYNFGSGGGGELRIGVGTFALKIGEALQIDASNLVITPGQATMVTLASATISSPQFADFGSGTLTNLAITQTGFSLGSLTLGQSGGQTVNFGNFLRLTGAQFSATDFAVAYGNTTTVTGTISVSATAISLFPNSTLFTTTVTDFATTYNFGSGGDGALRISVGTFALKIGEALQIAATNVVITPGQATILTLASATISSPQFADFGSGTLTNLAITQTGFSIGNLTLGQSGGQTVNFGNFLRLTGATFTATNFAVAYGSTTTVTGTLGLTATAIALFPDATLFTTTITDFSTTYNFGSGGDGALRISVGAFALKIGEALQIAATDVVITPGQATILTLASATISSPQFADFGSGSLTNLAITQTGFSLGNLTLGQSGGQTVNFGNFLRLTGATFTATNFAVAYGATTTVTGTIGLTATTVSLFPNSTLFTTTITDFSTTYNFGSGGDGALRISVGTFALKIGEALEIGATNVVITPGQATILTLASATISSPQFADFGSGTLTNLVITQTGFSLGNLTLGQSGGQTVNFGNFLRLTGATFTATNFAVAYGATTTVTGTIGLTATTVSLFPNSTLFTTTVTDFSTTYNFGSGGDGALRISVGTFALKIGEALQIGASNIVITPGQATLVTIASATISSPQFADFGTGSLTNLAITQTGFSLGSLTLGQSGGQTVNFGSFLRLTGATFTATNFAVAYGATTAVTGTIALNATAISLFPNSTLFTTTVTDFATTYNFSAGGDGALRISAGTFSLKIGEALQIDASDIVITPGQATILTLASATISSPQFADFGTGSLTNLAITQTGFSLGNLTLGQSGGQTATIGNFLRLTGAQLTATNFAVAYGSTTTVSGTIALTATAISLFPNSTLFTTTVTDLSATYNFGSGGDGALRISAGTFSLKIGEALDLSATDIVITPGQATILTIASATISSPQFSELGTGSLTNLVITQTGFSLGSLSLGQSAGQTVNFGNFLRLTGSRLTATNFSVAYGSTTTVSGTITVSASAVSLFPNATIFTTTVTDFSIAYSFGAGGDGALRISAGTFALKIGEALNVSATNIVITPGQATMLTIGSATISSPQFSELGTGSLTNLAVTQTGFTLGSLTLGGSGQTVTMGSFLQLTGAKLAVTNLAVSYGSSVSVSGTVTVSAANLTLFPGSTFLTTTVTGLSASYSFGSGGDGALRISASTFILKIGEALELSATDIVITPGASTILTIGTASVSSPALAELGTATLTNFVVRQNGFSFGQFSIGQAAGQTVNFGSFLQLTGARLNINNFNLTVGPSGTTVTGGIGLTAGGITLFPGSSAFTSTITGFALSYDFGAGGAGALRISATSFSLKISTALEITATDIVITPGQATILTIGSATVSSPAIAGLTGSMTNFAVTQNGFSIGSLDLTPVPNGTVKLGDILTFTGITFGVRNFVYNNTTHAITGTITVGAASASLFPGNTTFSASVTNITGGYTLGGTGIGALSLSIGGLSIKLGTYLTFTGTNIVITPEADTVLTVGSISATVTAGGLSIGGTGSNFAIKRDGSFVALAGFGVGLDLGTSAASLKWPSWLPIQITALALKWRDVTNAPLDFSITLSASVTGLNGLPLTVSGSVNGLVIDLGELAKGNFPITDLGSASITISGNMFGGQASGSLALGVVRLSAAGDQIAATDTTTAVARRVLYGGLRASFTFGGLSGFSISIGLSELGPISIYMSAGIPVLLEPTSGLSITNFRAGITFNTSLPSITDPLALRGSAFKPSGQLTDAEWVASLEAAVVNQSRAPPGGSFWDAFSQTMKIEGGATIYSAYASTSVFRADVDIILSTDGKFVVNGDFVFADNLKLRGTLYADLSAIKTGAGRILFLVDAPASTPVMTIFGGIEFKFTRLDGKTVTTTQKADAFSLIFTGGVTYSLAGLANVTISGSVELLFSASRFDLNIKGSVNLPLLGDALGVAGAFHLTTNGTTQFWGALVVQPNFTMLAQLGLTVDGAAILRVNSTTTTKTETLNIPGRGVQTFNLTPQSVSVLIQGVIGFSLSGAEWFRVEGEWGMELTPTRLSVLATGTLYVGAKGSEFLAFNYQGFFQISSAGIAAKLVVTLKTGFPASVGLSLNASFVLELNTTKQTVSFTLPEGTAPINGTRSITVAAGPPGSAAAPYLRIDATGDLRIMDAVTMTGTFSFLASPTVLQLTATATLALKAGSTTILNFKVAGGVRIDRAGAVAAFDLTLATGIPSSMGFSLSATYRFEFNSTNKAQVIAGIELEAGRYVRVRATGTLTVSGLALVGNFGFTVGSVNGVATLEVLAAASLDLKAGSTTIFSFGVAGGLRITSAGIAAGITLTVSGGAPSGLGFSFSVSGKLEINTTNSAQTIGSVTLAAGPYARVLLAGSLTVGGFSITGAFGVTVTSTSLSVAAAASITLFGATAGLSGSFAIYSDGLVIDVTLSLPSINSTFFSLAGTFNLKVNSTSRTVSNIAAKTYLVSVIGARLTVVGLTLTGSITIGISNGVFSITIPASSPLTVNFFGFASVSVSGFLNSNGQFSFTGNAALSIGNTSIAGLSGTLTLTIGTSGFSGAFAATAYIFGQNVTTVNASISAGTFSFSANVGFSVPGVNLFVRGNINLSVGTNGIWGNFTVGGSLFGVISVNAAVEIDTRTSYWLVTAGFSASLGGSSLGVSFNGTVTASSIVSRCGISIGGSAWAGFNISYPSGVYWFGVRWSTKWVGGTISFSAGGDLSGNLNFSLKIAGISVSFHLSLNGGFRLWGSDIAGGYAFLDTKGTGVWDPSMPRVAVDGDGNFSFAVGDPAEWVIVKSGGYAFRDSNGNGIWDEETESRAPLDADGTLPDILQRLLDPSVDLSAGATDAASALGRLRDFALRDADGAVTGTLDLTKGQVQAIGGFIVDPNNPGTETLNTGAIALGSSATGLTGLNGAGQTVFFDTNGNGRLDAGEISTTADANGFYTFAPDLATFQQLGLLAAFDTNGNGKIDPEEGTIVLTGGRDKNNGLAASPVIKVAAADVGGFSATASPLTNLRAALMQLGLTGSEADSRITYVFRLSKELNLTVVDPTDSALNAEDRVAVLRVTSQIESLVLNGASLLSAASGGALDFTAAQQKVVETLAAYILDNGIAPPPGAIQGVTPLPDLTKIALNIDLTDTAMLGAFFNRAALANGLTLQIAAIEAAARITAALNLAAAGYAAITNTSATRDLARIDALAQGAISDALGQVVTGGLSADTAVARYTGSALTTLLNAVALVPVTAPVFVQPDNVASEVNAPITPIALDISSATTIESRLVVTATSSNEALLKSSAISIQFNRGEHTLLLEPTAGQTGTTIITVQVADGDAVTTRTFVLAITPPPTLAPRITTSPITTAVIGETYSYTVTVRSLDTARTFVITAGETLPAWLTLTDNGDGTASLVGTPPSDLHGADLIIPIFLKVTDDKGATTVQEYKITVTGERHAAPVLSVGEYTRATAGTPFSLDLTAAADEAAGHLTFAVSAGLPTWLTLKDNGDGTAVLTGSPTRADVGAVQFTVSVTDATGQITTREIAFAVVPNLVISAISDLTLAEDSAARTIAFTLGGIDPTTAKVSVASSNATLISTSNLVLSGTGTERTLTLTPRADASGTATVTLTLIDGEVSITRTFEVNVAAQDDSVTALRALPAFVLNAGSDALTVDLTRYFSDRDHTTTFALGHNSDAALLGARIEGTQLILTPAAARAGLASLEVIATSIGESSGQTSTVSGTIRFTVLPTVSLSGPAYVRLANGAVVARFTIALNVASNQAVRVAYATSAGTARESVDYTAAQGYVDIAAGSKTATIDVLLAGTSFERGLTFGLALSSSLSALLAAQRSAQVDIPVDRVVLFNQSNAGGSVGFGIVVSFLTPLTSANAATVTLSASTAPAITFAANAGPAAVLSAGGQELAAASPLTAQTSLAILSTVSQIVGYRLP